MCLLSTMVSPDMELSVHVTAITSAPGDPYVSVHIRRAGDWTGALFDKMSAYAKQVEVRCPPVRTSVRLMKLVHSLHSAPSWTLGAACDMTSRQTASLPACGNGSILAVRAFTTMEVAKRMHDVHTISHFVGAPKVTARKWQCCNQMCRRHCRRHQKEPPASIPQPSAAP